MRWRGGFRDRLEKPNSIAWRTKIDTRDATTRAAKGGGLEGARERFFVWFVAWPTGVIFHRRCMALRYKELGDCFQNLTPHHGISSRQP